MSRSRDFSWIACAYVVAFGVAVGVAFYAQDFSTQPLVLSAIADVAATFVIFAFSCAFRNSSFYDAYWSVAPPLLVGYWLIAYGVLDIRLILIFVLVLLWAIRLTHNWARGWRGLAHEDWRYIDLKAKTGVAYPLVDLLGIQLLPTALVFVGCVPVWLVIVNSQTPGAQLYTSDLIWILVGYGALYLEYRADNILRRFRLDLANHGKVLREDVWGWCRHPNYLGELGFWLALGIAGYQLSGSPWAWGGIFAMVVLFIGISVPMIDKRQLANKPDYAEYKKSVWAFLPLPPKSNE
ncbi:MAG: DUF1295 domain-containing protein [Pseudomonadota bacterium]